MQHLLILVCFLCLQPTTGHSFNLEYLPTTSSKELRPIKQKIDKKNHKKYLSKKKKARLKKRFKLANNKGKLAGGIVMVVFGSIFLLLSLIFLLFSLTFFGSGTVLIFLIIFLLAGLGLVIPGSLLIKSYNTNKTTQVDRASSPPKTDTIYLKDGSILRGNILEINHPKNIKIEIAGGSIFVIEYDKIEKVESK